MGDRQIVATCLSVDKHDDNVLNVCLHYFGCLKYSERIDYFESLNEIDKNLIRDRERRINNVKEFMKRDEDTIPPLNALANSLRIFRTFPKVVLPHSHNASGTKPVHRSSDGMSARMVLFRNSEPFTDEKYPQEWPDQKLPLGDLLRNTANGSNPLARHWSDNDNAIQWFHLPSNNMEWVEEAISRYHGEKTPNLSFSGPPSETRTLLHHEFWRGQQQGGDLDPTHARHMKPRCDIISMHPSLKKNLVLYMPYMHWDTYRKTSIRSKITKSKEEVHAEERKKIEDERYVQRLRRSRPIPEGGKKTAPSRPGPSRRKSSILRLFGRSRSLDFENQGQSGSNLGRVFLAAAILFEKIEYFHDELSLQSSLYAQAPLHPRRTLHQYRYGTRKSTDKLDKTQVVYRRTAPSKEYLHHPACKEEDRRKCQHAHCEQEDTLMFRDCRQCFSDSQKLPRLIMVDQLWLWVLDGKTIITSFPRSWGRDPHSVHKRIRMRLKTLLPGEIHSAYDLAQIIVDQCSGVIFDRTRIMQNQPPIIDMFQDAIGNISDKQTLAASHFWSNVAEASRVFNSQDKIETTTMYRIFLNVIREGKLLAEVQGILDELHIMLHIQDQQKRVLRSFSKHVARLLSASKSTPDPTARKLSYADLSALAPPSSPGISRQRPGDYFHVDPSRIADHAKNTMSHVRELTENLDDHIADLTNLEENAMQISKTLERLVDLKLQQAGVIQAQEASEEALKQGRSIMLFTVITIIFLPMSFVASVFSMSTAATDFRDGLMTFREEFLYMVPTSLAFAIIVLVLALSSAVRGMIIFSLQLPWTWFTTSTSLDLVWEGLIPNGRTLRERSLRRIRDLKARANLARHAQAETRSEKAAIGLIAKQAVETLGDFSPPVRASTTDTIGSKQIQVVETFEDKLTSGDIV